jgi:integrase/recombinase XerD
MKIATTAIILDTRRAKKGLTYPLKLRVIYNRVVKYYPTKYNLTEDQYSKLFEERPTKKIKEIREDAFAIQARAKDIIGAFSKFTFKSFETKLFKYKTGQGNLTEAYNDYTGVLKLAGRISTAVSYECSINSLRTFRGELHFEDITVEFLNDYENWMLEKGNSLTSVGIYLRALRSVFNEAIVDQSVSNELYPFGKRKYQIPSGRNTKKALQISDIKKIYEYEPNKDGSQEKARDFWLFSYLCNGINMKDIARLKYRDIEGDYLTFIRAKTERTTRSNPKPISIYLNHRAKEIINRWGNPASKPDKYIFPILQPGCSPEREMKLVQQFTKNVNKWMKAISSKLGIGKPITTYTARHSFSTVLKRSGASIEFISEALGHSNVRTTESYLDSFENESKKNHSALLTAF